MPEAAGVSPVHSSMTSVAEHYASLLAPVYVWMAGGLESALARGEAEVEALGLDGSPGLVAVDLGAGFGMHALPLAQRGWQVLAVDSSNALLEVLRGQTGALPIRSVEDDLLAFTSHLPGAPALVLCMGDTLTHLPDAPTVGRLLALVAESLRPGGTFVATFRDYTPPLVGERRFISVRSDADRILTCFLEYAPEHVEVHDLLHERVGAAWFLRVGTYRKLRLSPSRVVETLQARGLSARAEPGPAGMTRIVATKSGRPC